MNRPKLEDYMMTTNGMRCLASDFNKYCDELEKAVNYLAYKLDSLGDCNNSGMCDTKEKSCYECWKEWALRGVSEGLEDE